MALWRTLQTAHDHLFFKRRFPRHLPDTWKNGKSWECVWKVRRKCWKCISCCTRRGKRTVIWFAGSHTRMDQGFDRDGKKRSAGQKLTLFSVAMFRVQMPCQVVVAHFGYSH